MMFKITITQFVAISIISACVLFGGLMVLGMHGVIAGLLIVPVLLSPMLTLWLLNRVRMIVIEID